MWENTVWEEIQDVTTVYAEVEQIKQLAGVREQKQKMKHLTIYITDEV